MQLRLQRDLALFLLIAQFVLSSHCAREEDEQAGVVTITFWHSFVSTTRPALKKLLAKFEAENPDIRVKEQYVPTGDGLIQKLVTAIQSQTAPDVSWIHADFLDKLVQGDAIYPMRHFMEGADGLTEQEYADIFPQLLQNATWQGELYAMPMEATALALFYNKDAFRQVGLDPDRPPENWQELYDFARKLTFDSDGDGTMDQYGFYLPALPASGALSIWMTLNWLPYLWQSGGVEIDDDQTKVLFNRSAGAEALTFWKKLYIDLNLRTFSMTHDLGFVSGRLAMVMDGPWDLPRFREIENFEWAVAPLPRGSRGQVTYLAGEHLAIFKQSRHPNEAWRFVKWVIEPENQALFSMESGYLPVRKSVLQRAEYLQYLETDQALDTFVQHMASAQSRRPLDFHRVEINQHLAEAIEKATVGDMDPKAVLDEAARKSNELLASSRSKRLSQSQ